MSQPDAVLVTCAHCGARNRVPTQRLGQAARCGQCHQPLEVRHARGADHLVQMRCSQCHARNRVPTERLEDHPRCGKCGSALRTEVLDIDRPFPVSAGNFDDKVLRSPLPVLVFAMSPGCPTCVMVEPHIDTLAREMRGKALVGKLNVQFEPELATRFDLLSVPYLLVFDGGKLKESRPGALDLGQLRNLLRAYL